MEQVHDIKHGFQNRHSEEANGKQKGFGTYFNSMKPWVLFLFIVAISMAVIIFGVYIGRQKLINGINEPETSIGTSVGSVLGLLAFILGFTFSITWTRFVNRNSLVVDHATAIGLCYLSAGMIPEKQKSAIRNYLQEYTALLLNIRERHQVETDLARLNDLQTFIWLETESLLKEDMDGELRSVFIGSAKEMIGLALKRKTIALFIRIPQAIWTSLLLLSAMGMLVFGYQAGISGINKLFQLVLLPMSFGLIILLIIQLNAQDLPHFQVTKRPLIDVLEMMERNASTQSASNEVKPS